MNELLSICRVKGKNSRQFLQGQLTADIQSVTSENGCLAALCNIKGRVVSLMIVLADGEDFLLCLPTDAMALTLERLQKPALFSRIQLLTTQDDITLHLLRSSTEIAPPYSTFHENGLILCVIPGDNRLLGIAKSQEPDLTKYQLCSVTDWQLADCHAGIPMLHAIHQERYLAHPLRLDKLGAISFSKGCYLGQEIIARTQYLGQVKKHTVRATITLPSSINDLASLLQKPLIVGEKTVGEVINAISTTENSQTRCELLVMLQDSVLKEEIALEISPGLTRTLTIEKDTFSG